MKLRFAFILTFMTAHLACAHVDEAMRRQIGQMVMIGFKGTKTDDEGVKAVVEMISKDHLGGVILFKHNIESPEQLKTLTLHLQNAAQGHEPLLIAVDQEGGKVQRLSKTNGFTGFKSAKEVAEEEDALEASFLYEEMAHELAFYGINFNLAPVVDLAANKNSKVIYENQRSFHEDPNLVADYTTGFVHAHRLANVFTALKHWPGHGSAAGDSHLGMVDVTKTWTLAERIPYERLIAEGMVDAIMTAHVFHRDFDAHKPATLSKKLVQEELREKLNYDGVVLSDCLQMGAITAMFGDHTEDAAAEAIIAGVDIALLGNFHISDYDFVERTVNAIAQKSQKDGGEMKKRLCESGRRIAKLKQKIGGKGPTDISCVQGREDL